MSIVLLTLCYLLTSEIYVSAPSFSIHSVPDSSESLEPESVAQVGSLCRNQGVELKTLDFSTTKRKEGGQSEIILESISQHGIDHGIDNRSKFKRNLHKIWSFLCCCLPRNHSLLNNLIDIESPRVVDNLLKRYDLDIGRICYSGEALIRKTKRILYCPKDATSKYSNEEILYVSKNIRFVQRRIETLFDLFEKYSGMLPNSFSVNSEPKNKLESIYRQLTVAFYDLERAFPSLKARNNPFMIIGLPKNIGGCPDDPI